jgi:NAD dependent epimerase/dehydratase family enzyme
LDRILTDRLWNQFHSLVLLSRKPPAEVGVAKKEWFAWNPPAGGSWEQALDGADGIVNLAGEPIAGKRWSKEQKEILRKSRIDLNRPSWMSVPPSALALIAEEMADMLLTGQRAVPEAAVKLGYQFKYPMIDDALRSLRL